MRRQRRWASLLGAGLALTAGMLVSNGAQLGVARAEPGHANAKLADEDIAAAVEDELFSDPAVPHNDIEVGTSAGVVTLTGTVNNLLAREHARRLAQTVRGVRSVVNRIQVVPRSQKSDEQLRQDVERALAYDPAADAYQVQVSVSGGVAKLTGRVDSFAERELSERVARTVGGLRDVRNEIVVQYRSARADAEIARDIQARLRWDAYVDEDLLITQVNDGVVALSGKVGSDAERTRAYLDAWVAGVKGVKIDKLAVDPWLDRGHVRDPVRQVGDGELERAVSAALSYDPRVSSAKVRPRARNGVVTLHGTVDNLEAKQAAAEDARATTGVARVINRIHLRSTPANDAEVARAIRSAFGRDPYVERFELLVKVDDGIAYLDGTVDSYFEKMRADRIAARARGVTDVRNNLTVYDDRSPLVYEPRVSDYYPYDYTWYSYGPTTYLTDSEIREEIRGELFWSPFVSADEVKVKVDGGVATLEGTVDSYAEMHAALANAYEGGAVGVRNQLKVD